ncbi:transcription factor Jun-like [Ornithodoros turicata]
MSANRNGSSARNPVTTSSSAMDSSAFYEERRQELQQRKRSMTLDLESGGGASSEKKSRYSSLLTSPDLNMLQLASPELERLIIAHNGFVTTTPTPTQTQMLFSGRNATEEQENYARGFVDALAQLHNGGVGPDSESGSASNDSSIASSSMLVKDEPQTVPSLGATPPLSPIDMRDQERIKLERKRLRNRIAASKCRKRKLERISRLEDKVAGLKAENSNLASVVGQLRDQVCRLKQEVMQHVKQGCQIMVSNSGSRTDYNGHSKGLF